MLPSFLALCEMNTKEFSAYLLSAVSVLAIVSACGKSEAEKLADVEKRKILCEQEVKGFVLAAAKYAEFAKENGDSVAVNGFIERSKQTPLTKDVAAKTMPYMDTWTKVPIGKKTYAGGSSEFQDRSKREEAIWELARPFCMNTTAD